MMIKKLKFSLLLIVCINVSFAQKILDSPHFMKEKKIVLSKGEKKKGWWNKDKLAYTAVGLDNGFVFWKLYANKSPSDSILFVEKEGKLNGIYSEFGNDYQIVCHFKNGKRNGVAILRKRNKIVVYEMWQNGKLILSLDKNGQPCSDDNLIMTKYGEW